MLREKRDQANKVLDDVNQEIALLETMKADMNQKLEQKRQEYSAKGGDIVSQRQELFKKRSMVSSQINTLKEQLIMDAASELPFILVNKLLRNIRENAEIEQDQRMLSVALKKMRMLLPEYIKANETDKEAAESFIAFIDGKMCKDPKGQVL